MIDTDLKQTIQQGYSDFIKARGLKPRYGQRQMIATVANALSRDQAPRLCVVEAGTGTGKTMAYLLAAIPIAQQAEKQLVVATGTISLQEQLLDKDLPELVKTTGWAIDYTLIKGRGRYVCNLRLAQCLDAVHSKQAGLFLYEDELPFVPGKATELLYRELADALEDSSWAGDRDSWPQSIAEDQWRPLTIDGKQCSNRRCVHFEECAFFNARRDVDKADVIIANHDLVMSDLALGGGVILPPPEDTVYIFDEGHRLSDTGVRHFAAFARLQATEQWLAKLQKPLQQMQTTLAEDEHLKKQLARIQTDLVPLATLMAEFYPLIHRQLDQLGDTPVGARFRFPHGDVGEAIRDAAAQLLDALGLVHGQLSQLSDKLGNALNDVNFPVPRPDLEMIFPQVGNWLGRFDGLLKLFRWLAEPPLPSQPQVCWLTVVEGLNGEIDIAINASPIQAAPLLADGLWSRCYGAVVTSATLRALGSFDRFHAAVGMPQESVYQSVMGAFDYQQQAVLAVPADAVDGKDAELHSLQVIEQLPALMKEFDGTLVLFASRAQMQRVFDGLPIALQHQILVQGDMSHRELLRHHKARIDDGERSTLFGLASFAEGVDLPGRYCQHVIIAKLPFAVPDEPLQEALAEWIELQGGNAFFQMTLPDASLRLIQACGRLLRTEDDHGKVTLLDRRVVSKGYGRQLLDALPPFRRQIS